MLITILQKHISKPINKSLEQEEIATELNKGFILNLPSQRHDLTKMGDLTWRKHLLSSLGIFFLSLRL